MTYPDARVPDLSFVIPAANENRWSDLLASLIATDPGPMSALVGIDFDRVRREVVIPGQEARKSDRLDLLLVKDGVAAAAIEVKLLSELGPMQLQRYVAAFPAARVHRVLHLDGLPVNLQQAKPWESLTWESLLRAYAESMNAWVATTARAWMLQLPSMIPAVDAQTVWNDVPDDAAGMELALRARVAWLSRQLEGWCTLPHDIEPSSGGGTWAVRIWTGSRAPGHLVTAELQEGMSAFEWKADPKTPYRERLRGPVVLLGLRQDDVDTSADFDWAELHAMFARHVLNNHGAARDDRAWHLTAARPGDALDRANWQAIVAAGAPRWLGKGWGMKVAKSARSCLFGARFQIPADSTLGAIDGELRRLEPVIAGMA